MLISKGLLMPLKLFRVFSGREGGGGGKRETDRERERKRER